MKTIGSSAFFVLVFLLSTTNVRAELGGNCCADLEERTAEVERVIGVAYNISNPYDAIVYPGITLFQGDSCENVRSYGPLQTMVKLKVTGAIRCGEEIYLKFKSELGSFSVLKSAVRYFGRNCAWELDSKDGAALGGDCCADIQERVDCVASRIDAWIATRIKKAVTKTSAGFYDMTGSATSGGFHFDLAQKTSPVDDDKNLLVTVLGVELSQGEVYQLIETEDGKVGFVHSMELVE